MALAAEEQWLVLMAAAWRGHQSLQGVANADLHPRVWRAASAFFFERAFQLTLKFGGIRYRRLAGGTRTENRKGLARL
jgi:hypothetical protein